MTDYNYNYLICMLNERITDLKKEMDLFDSIRESADDVASKCYYYRISLDCEKKIMTLHSIMSDLYKIKIEGGCE